MKVKCGSCGSEYDVKLAECDNCGFPNRTFATPLRGPIIAEIELDLIHSMESRCRVLGISLSEGWTAAVQLFLTEGRKRKTS
jgi:hypothetical protein